VKKSAWLCSSAKGCQGRHAGDKFPHTHKNSAGINKEGAGLSTNCLCLLAARASRLSKLPGYKRRGRAEASGAVAAAQ